MKTLWIDGLSIAKRLTILVGIATLATLLTAFTGITNNKRLAQDIELGYNTITRPLAAVANARGSFNAMRTALYDLAQDFNSQRQNVTFQRHVSENLQDYERNIALYKEILDTHGTADVREQESVEYLLDQLSPMRVYVEHIAEIAAATGKSADAVRLLRDDFLRTANDISLELASLTKLLEAQTEAANRHASRLQRRNQMLVVLIMLAGTIFLLTVSSITVRSIVVPINEASAVLSRIAKGDFKARMRGRYRGDIALIKNSVNATALGLAFYLGDKLKAERSAYESELAKGRAEAAKEVLLSGINYASKIQNNLRPEEETFRSVFRDSAVIWEPRDIVGGDIYWMKRMQQGTVLCVCDCTGHGTPGALLTMLVASALENVVDEENCADTPTLMWRLDQRLAGMLHVDTSNRATKKSGILEFNDGCDAVLLFIANDGSVSYSAANMRLFVCDGKKVEQLKGQKLRIGDGAIESPDDVEIARIASAPDHCFYISSDGLFDQIGGAFERPFGYKIFKEVILHHHGASLSSVAEAIWTRFEEYRGEQARRDDVEVICFKPAFTNSTHHKE